MARLIIPGRARRGRRAVTVKAPTESQEQRALVAWAHLMAMDARAGLSSLSRLYAIPNGGWRTKATAARLRAEGVSPGVPDLHLPVARHGFFGLYLELKRLKGGRVSEDQAAWHDVLREEGYRVEVCVGSDAAQAVLRDYLRREG